MVALLLLFLCALVYNLDIKNPFQGNESNDSTDTDGSGFPTTANLCVDSDEGMSYYMPGYTLDQDNIKSYDKCEDNVLLKEYYCSNGKVLDKLFACPLGYECFQTRSGGYCDPLPSNTDGDLLGGESESGAVDDIVNVWEIDMDTIGSGNCQLGATLTTSWDYGDQATCSNYQNIEGVAWDFYDSSGLQYTRVDTFPLSLGVDLGCGFDYDGETPWLVQMTKTQGFIDCPIEFEWELRIVACNCQ